MSRQKAPPPSHDDRSVVLQLHAVAAARDHAREAAAPRWGWLVAELRNDVGAHGEPLGEDRVDVLHYLVGQCGSPGLAEQLLDLAIRREAAGAPHDEDI